MCSVPDDGYCLSNFKWQALLTYKTPPFSLLLCLRIINSVDFSAPGHTTPRLNPLSRQYYACTLEAQPPQTMVAGWT